VSHIGKWRLFFLLAVLIAGPTIQVKSARGQEGPRPPQSVPRVFFDCRGARCDNTYYRTEIDWVAWVRDQQDAHVHVIMTSQQTGVGGREFLLDFIGNETYQNYESRSRYQSLPTDTQREDLDGIALTLGIGLAQFATESGFRGVVQIDGITPVQGVNANADTPPEGILSPDEVQDPWNLWVFRINANGRIEGESSQETQRFSSGFRASRVTPTWIQRYNSNFSSNSREYELNDGSRFIDDRYDWSVSARVVYALAEHWSMGFNSRVGRNTRNNQRIWGQWNPAIEYSFFPYDEATRRSLTVFYEIGPVYRDYFDVTVYGEEEELRGEQALTLDFSQRQPWGNASIQIRGSTYLHEVERNNLSLRGNLSFRITRGLDLNVRGEYSRVRDQLFLSGEGLSNEERLLELKTQQTEYESLISFGFSYQFGSIFNNVVNNRFPGGRR